MTGALPAFYDSSLKKCSSKRYLPPRYAENAGWKRTQACPAWRSGAWYDEVERSDSVFNVKPAVLPRSKSMPALIKKHQRQSRHPFRKKDTVDSAAAGDAGRLT